MSENNEIIRLISQNCSEYTVPKD